MSVLTLSIGGSTYLLLKKFQVSSAFILNILSIIAFIIPSCLPIPFFYFLFIIVFIIVVIQCEVSFTFCFLPFCI